MKAKSPQFDPNQDPEKILDSQDSSDRREFLKQLAASSGSALLTSTLPFSSSFLMALMKSSSAEAQYPIAATWKRQTARLWGWGNDTYGELGIGSIGSKSSPVMIEGKWKTIATGIEFSIGIRPDGSMWSWGRNNLGQLGLGNTINWSSPVQIGALTNWARVYTGSQYAFAIKTDGTLWSWGANSYGQLGISATGPKSSPVQVGSLTSWSQIAAGESHTLGLRIDGTLWSWGENADGELGIGTSGAATYKSSPMQVGANTTWTKISAGVATSYGLRSDGTLWAWGSNGFGQLGYGGIAGLSGNRSSPVQIGGTWSQVAAGHFHCLGVRQDGALGAWGYNGAGHLGDGTTVQKSTPSFVVAGTWSQVSAGWGHSLAIRSDGTLWTWGSNGSGELGLGDTTNRSSPVQISGTWSAIAATKYRSFGIRTK